LFPGPRQVLTEMDVLRPLQVVYARL